MSTPREPIDNRERILEAAEALFAEQGFAATSVREIVQRAEVTAPVLYYYFGSKDDLLRIMIEQRFSEFIERTHATIDAANSLESLIRGWTQMLIRDNVEHPTTLRLILSSLWGPPVPHIRETMFRAHSMFSETFCRAVQSYLPDACVYRSRFALGALHGMLNTFMVPVLGGLVPSTDDDDELVNAIVPRILSIFFDGHPLPNIRLRMLDELSRCLADNDTP